jgi:hypothetical protein
LEPASALVAKIEWHRGELFPHLGLVVTNSRLPAGIVIKFYNVRAEIENRTSPGAIERVWEKDKF